MALSRRCEKLLSKARVNPGGLRFAEARRLAECLGLRLTRVRGSHFVYKGAGYFANLLPERDGTAKRYQVVQLLKIADRME